MLAIVSCRDSANIYVSDELPPIWPDYTSVTIPINIAPLDFGMEEWSCLRQGRQPVSR